LFIAVLHSNVSKVDRVLHMGYAWKAGEGANGPAQVTWLGPCVGAGDAGAVEQCPGSTDPCVDARNGVGKPTAAASVRPDVRALAVP
jgi:hypothetical protein